MTTLKEQREQAGWTQADVAQHTGVDIRTIRRWEAANVPPRRVSLMYASIFGTPNVADDAEMHGDSSTVLDGPVSISDVIQQQPDRLQISGPLAKLLGHLPQDRPFSILLGGASGGGKSSLALMLASTLAEHSSVLYCTSEERIDSGTIGIRAKQLEIDDVDIDVIEVDALDRIEEHLTDGPYRFCVIDSVNELEIGPADVIALMNDHRDISWILIAQADATEKATVGGARWRHLVDIRLWCEVDKDGKRTVRNLKNRFAPEVSYLTLHGGASTPLIQPDKVKAPRPSKTQTHTSKEDKMPEYQDWIIRRLEVELDNARKETEALRTKLEARDERIRALELKVNRFEVEQELSTDDSPSSLSDKFDPEVIGRMADKLAPFAMIVGDLVKGLRPSGPTAPIAAYAMPTHNPFAYSADSPDDSALLFPNKENKQ
ncbi:MAG: helix-turn-helix domain-containing protein [Candidatus Kapaibacterium sp.]|nr:MAG: helix-turn-helix domain-containing protein [Candidatus Kapabacteria bacterium]